MCVCRGIADISTFGPSAVLYKHTAVRPNMFTLCNDDSDVFSNISANTPDVILVNEIHREVLILEIACTFDY